MEIIFRHIITDEREKTALAPMERLCGRAGLGFQVRFQEPSGGISDGDDRNINRLEQPPEYLLPPFGVPDVFMAYGEELPILAERNLIAPLDDLVQDHGLEREDFHPGLLESLTWKGELWGIPIEANPYALFINEALFEQAGIQSDPTTWDELDAAARKLMLQLPGDIEPRRYGYTQCTFQVPLLMWQAGCEILDRECSRVLFGSRQGAEALLFHSNIRDTSPPHVDFEKNDVGMKLSIIENLVSGRYDHLKFHTVKLPKGKVEANSYGGSTGALVLALGKSDPKREAMAKDFIRFFAMPDASMLWSTTTGYVPVRKSLLGHERWLEFMDGNPNMKPFVESLLVARGRHCHPATRQIKWIMANTVHMGRQSKDRSLEAMLRIMQDHARLAQDVLDGKGFYRPGKPGLEPCG